MSFKSAAFGFLKILWQILVALNLLMLCFDFSVTPVYWRGVVFSSIMIVYCLYFLWRRCQKEAEEKAKYSFYMTLAPGADPSTLTGNYTSNTGTVQISQTPPSSFTTTGNASAYTFEENPDAMPEDGNPPPEEPPEPNAG